MANPLSACFFSDDFEKKWGDMGGYGSGRRIDSKKTTDSQCKIDVRKMKKEGALVRGASGNISWWCRDKETGSIGYRVEDKRLIINYHSKQNGGERQSTIYFFGNQRKGFSLFNQTKVCKVW